jgi:hypothetical protein
MKIHGQVLTAYFVIQMNFCYYCEKGNGGTFLCACHEASRCCSGKASLKTSADGGKLSAS